MGLGLESGLRLGLGGDVYQLRINCSVQGSTGDDSPGSEKSAKKRPILGTFMTGTMSSPNDIVAVDAFG